MEVGVVPIVIVMLPTAIGKSSTITLNLHGAIPKLYMSVVGLLFVVTKLHILHHQILSPLTG
jgi:hypothetical protein